ncbi:MAG: DNA primase catalytic subunit PriS, partial [Candidatus Marsarchaeota archaeon]|nr:DNA primase catalytic subunit PriS [Candidatus Marsarchaeota archaeon]
MLDLQTQEFTKRLLKEYYSKASADDIAPPHAKSREYGFGDFEKKISFRHKAFASANELKKYIVDNAPAFISYSSAEYESPDARPMENKGWLGSELIFDLDATDLHLECQKQHGRSWVCDNCLDSVKSETVRLVEDFLMPDF